ncbi:hypothetical protein J6590_006256 [Homalodisca vitripennis]|nr:hypothetical protein J6590_006256 [Homalodisca vitripennis]
MATRNRKVNKEKQKLRVIVKRVQLTEDVCTGNMHRTARLRHRILLKSSHRIDTIVGEFEIIEMIIRDSISVRGKDEFHKAVQGGEKDIDASHTDSHFGKIKLRENDRAKYTGVLTFWGTAVHAGDKGHYDN